MVRVVSVATEVEIEDEVLKSTEISIVSKMIFGRWVGRNCRGHLCVNAKSPMKLKLLFKRHISRRTLQIDRDKMLQ